MSDEPVTGLNGPIAGDVQRDMDEFAEIHLRLIHRNSLLKKRSRSSMFFKNWKSRICMMTIIDDSAEEDEHENWKPLLAYFTEDGDTKGSILVEGVYPIDFWENGLAGEKFMFVACPFKIDGNPKKEEVKAAMENPDCVVFGAPSADVMTSWLHYINHSLKVCADLRMNVFLRVMSEAHEGGMALQGATAMNFCPLMKLLLEEGANVDVSADDTTPIFLAESAEAVSILAGAGANLNHTGPGDLRPLEMAILGNKPEVLQAFFDNGADLSMAATAALLHDPAASGFAEIISILLKAGAEINLGNDANDSALTYAAREGQMECLSLLVGAGANIDHKNDLGVTPLMAAAGNGHLPVIKYLVEYGADTEAQIKVGGTCLMMALVKGYADVANYLIDEVKVDVNEPAYGEGGEIMGYALAFAASSLNVEVVETILQAGAKVDAVNNTGCTPLAIVIEETDTGLPVIQALLRAGANVNTVDSAGWVPLIHACVKGNLEYVKELLAAGAKVDTVLDDGCTALSIAKHFNFAEVVAALEAAGARDGEVCKWKL